MTESSCELHMNDASLAMHLCLARRWLAGLANGVAASIKVSNSDHVPKWQRLPQDVLTGHFAFYRQTICTTFNHLMHAAVTAYVSAV